MSENGNGVSSKDGCPECGCDAIIKRWDTWQGKGRVYIGMYCNECDYSELK